jgi:hypothetical protein
MHDWQALQAGFAGMALRHCRHELQALIAGIASMAGSHCKKTTLAWQARIASDITFIAGIAGR